jgi:hypothetical protein
MDYNFYSLNPRTFEQLIQSLARKLLGNGMITFGDGPDGGREAVFDGMAPKEKDKDQKRFLELCLGVGNDILRPGYGKSTLTQFLCQVYRAYFLKNLDSSPTPLPEIPGFIADFQKIMPIAPTCFRFPARILLKDFAGWLAEQKAKKENHSLLMYLKYRIEKKGPGTTIDIGDIEQLLGKLSFVFIFDGLDEVPATSNREEVLTEIRNFIEIDLRRCDGDALIIATTRPQGYTNEFDRSGYTHLTLADLPAGDRPKALRLTETVKQRLKTIPTLPGFIIRLIEKLGLKGDGVEAILLEVYPLVDRHDHDVKTPFENYFKDLLESQPSHLDDPEVQKTLKL